MSADRGMYCIETAWRGNSTLHARGRPAYTYPETRRRWASDRRGNKVRREGGRGWSMLYMVWYGWHGMIGWHARIAVGIRRYGIFSSCWTFSHMMMSRGVQDLLDAETH